MLEELENGQTDVFEFSFKSVTNNYDWENTFCIPDEELTFTENSLSHYNYSSLWTHIFRTTLINNNNIRFGKSRVGEDIYFAYQCYFLCRTVKRRTRTIYCYYKNPESVTHTGASGAFLGSFCLETERYNWLLQYGIDKEKDCDYQRLLTARRYVIAICKENRYFVALKTISGCCECNVLVRYNEFSPPEAIQKEIILWNRFPLLFWLKCKLVYKMKDRISGVGIRHPSIGKVMDAVVYSHRGYTRVSEERRKRYQEDCG